MESNSGMPIKTSKNLAEYAAGILRFLSAVKCGDPLISEGLGKVYSIIPRQVLAGKMPAFLKIFSAAGAKTFGELLQQDAAGVRQALNEFLSLCIGYYLEYPYGVEFFRNFEQQGIGKFYAVAPKDRKLSIDHFGTALEIDYVSLGFSCLKDPEQAAFFVINSAAANGKELPGQVFLCEPYSAASLRQWVELLKASGGVFAVNPGAIVKKSAPRPSTKGVRDMSGTFEGALLDPIDADLEKGRDFVYSRLPLSAELIDELSPADAALDVVDPPDVSQYYGINLDKIPQNGIRDLRELLLPDAVLKDIQKLGKVKSIGTSYDQIMKSAINFGRIHAAMVKKPWQLFLYMPHFGRDIAEVEEKQREIARRAKDGGTSQRMRVNISDALTSIRDFGFGANMMKTFDDNLRPVTDTIADMELEKQIVAISKIREFMYDGDKERQSDVVRKMIRDTTGLNIPASAMGPAKRLVRRLQGISSVIHVYRICAIAAPVAEALGMLVDLSDQMSPQMSAIYKYLLVAGSENFYHPRDGHDFREQVTRAQMTVAISRLLYAMHRGDWKSLKNSVTDVHKDFQSQLAFSWEDIGYVNDAGRDIASHPGDDIEQLNGMINEYCPRAKGTAQSMVNVILTELKRIYPFTDGDVAQRYARIVASLTISRIGERDKTRLEGLM